jgi:hypothetical protein
VRGGLSGCQTRHCSDRQVMFATGQTRCRYARSTSGSGARCCRRLPDRPEGERGLRFLCVKQTCHIGQPSVFFGHLSPLSGTIAAIGSSRLGKSRLQCLLYDLPFEELDCAWADDSLVESVFLLAAPSCLSASSVMVKTSATEMRIARGKT